MAKCKCKVFRLHKRVFFTWGLTPGKSLNPCNCVQNYMRLFMFPTIGSSAVTLVSKTFTISKREALPYIVSFSLWLLTLPQHVLFGVQTLFSSWLLTQMAQFSGSYYPASKPHSPYNLAFLAVCLPKWRPLVVGQLAQSPSLGFFHSQYRVWASGGLKPLLHPHLSLLSGFYCPVLSLEAPNCSCHPPMICAYFNRASSFFPACLPSSFPSIKTYGNHILCHTLLMS